MDTSPLNIGCLGFSAFALLYGLYSMFLKERLYLSEALLATIIGILLKVLFIEKSFLNDTEILFQSCRFIIAIQVMAAGVSLPAKYLWTEWKSLFFLLGPLMTMSWLIVAQLIYFLFELDFVDSLLISSCVTPTDPILANSIVKGRFAEKYVPKHIRLLLSAES
jgi:NhaP-type Na+/H+ or K+/H+ antiporter